MPIARPGPDRLGIDLTIVIPVYNSEQTVFRVVAEAIGCLRKHYSSVEFVLVNDGSRDRSLAELRRCRDAFPEVRWVELTRNFGEHNAVMCGLREARGRYVAIMDDDGQHLAEDIPRLVDKLREGYDVAFSSYKRKRHSALRNLGSRFNNWVARRTLGKPADLYLSSFKALRAEIAQEIVRYTGPYPYVDGLVLRVTQLVAQVPCSHSERIAGRSNYGLRKLTLLWLNMATGFSILPLRLVAVLGWMTSVFALALAVVFSISWLTGGVLACDEFPLHWGAVIVSVMLFSGVQLLVAGLLGEYLGRLYLHGNGTPQFVVRTRSD